MNRKKMELFFRQHKEVILYLVFGGIAFFLNLGLFAFIDALGMNELINNAICWIVCVCFQYVTNKTWVFEGKAESTAALIKQIGGFISGRLATLVIEEVILAIFITWLGCPAIAVKLAAQVIVIVLNYVISKWIVFKK